MPPLYFHKNCADPLKAIVLCPRLVPSYRYKFLLKLFEHINQNC